MQKIILQGQRKFCIMDTFVYRQGKNIFSRRQILSSLFFESLLQFRPYVRTRPVDSSRLLLWGYMTGGKKEGERTYVFITSVISPQHLQSPAQFGQILNCAFPYCTRTCTTLNSLQGSTCSVLYSILYTLYTHSKLRKTSNNSSEYNRPIIIHFIPELPFI